MSPRGTSATKVAEDDKEPPRMILGGFCYQRSSRRMTATLGIIIDPVAS